MGWTGMFNWNSWEKNSEILEREFFGSAEKNYESVQWSNKGGHTWCLYKNKETNIHYAMVVLCQRHSKDHEFCYKEIELSSGPYVYDMPVSWFPLIKDTYKDSEWAQEWFKRREEWLHDKKTNKFEIGDYFKCEAKYDIEWNDGFKIKENEVFYINISCLNPYAKKKTKAFAVVKPGKEYGGGYVMQRSYHRLSASTFKNLKSVVKLSEDEVKQICEDYHQKVLEQAKKDFGVA